jgi:hypothetical protein
MKREDLRPPRWFGPVVLAVMALAAVAAAGLGFLHA